MSKNDSSMVRRYVLKGGNEQAGIALLRDLRRTVGANNLPAALAYNGFISARAAETMA